MDAVAASKDGAAAKPLPAKMPSPNAPPPFLMKTYDMVDDTSTDKMVSWGPNNNTFVVWDPPEFAKEVLPKYFKHSNFTSFIRQLNIYGFRKVDPDRWEFANEGFLRGQKHLLKSISRRKPVPGQNNQHSQQNRQSLLIGACVEVGKFGLEEEVERLKRDKNILMQELVRLRQQQQNTDNQLQSTTQRLQGMEQRQQQMMSFLTNTVHSPGFLAKFVQQQNESERRITEGSKKRRFKTEGNGVITNHLSDGQIVKYQPMMNGAAKAGLRQVIKSDTSPRLGNFENGSDAFLITDGGPMTRTSGVTLQEVPQSSSSSFLELNSGATEQNLSCAMSDIQFPSLGTDSEMVQSIVVGEQNMASPQIDSVIPDIDDMANITSSGMNDEITFEEFMNAEFDWDNTLIDDDMGKLPEIDDLFCEQLLSSTQLPGENEEMDSACMETAAKEKEAKTLENGWDKVQDMEHTT